MRGDYKQKKQQPSELYRRKPHSSRNNGIINGSPIKDQQRDTEKIISYTWRCPFLHA